MYSIYDYAYNGLLYLNNIMQPRHKRLSQLMIYSTTACQSQCKHCNIWQKKVEHLSLEDIKRIMQSKCITKRTTVGLEGGEFILHPQADEIMAWFREHHPNYTLLSNCLAPRRVIDAVRRYQPRHLYVSLDGDRETYQRMRGRDGYDRVIEVVEALKDEVPLSLMFCLSPWNTFEGKSLFIEKPPCRTLEELYTLIDLQRLHGSPAVMVGLQKRYAPAIKLLKKRLNKEHLINYDLHYLTGAYPEGDALLDLYIHPLDLVCFLFGKPEILAYRQIAEGSCILMLHHPHIVGTLELSTAYSWTDAEESLKVCTCSGSYHLSQMEELSFTPSSRTVSSIPMEKLRPHKKTVEYLYQNNSFTPILSANQVYSQGYYNELATFVEAVEHHDSHVISTLETIKDTYRLMDNLKRT